MTDPFEKIRQMIEDHRRTMILLCGKSVRFEATYAHPEGHHFVFQSSGYFYEVPGSTYDTDWEDSYKYDHMKCSVCGVYQKEWEIEFKGGKV